LVGVSGSDTPALRIEVTHSWNFVLCT